MAAVPAATYGTYEVWEQPSGDSTQKTWTIASPDGGLYAVSLMSPAADMERRSAEVRTMLESLELSLWEAPPQVVKGRIHVDTKRGFAFDYPAGWTIYWPQDISMMDSAVVTVASAPLLPPCAGDTCQRFSTPPRTIAIEFRIGGGPTSPDWSKAPTTIGGQPAFGPEDWGPENATSAEEAHSWNVRLKDRNSLEIFASLRGPGLDDLRGAMDEVLGSIQIEP
jgi:hypothetical protein